MSLLRDGDYALLGYLNFALLLGAATLLIRRLARLRRWADVALAAAALMLSDVAATGSFDALHQVASFVLLGYLYAYYLFVLWDAASLWLIPHAAFPSILTAATLPHSFGLWQKSTILYLPMIANLHYTILGSWMPAGENDESDEPVTHVGPVAWCRGEPFIPFRLRLKNGRAYAVMAAGAIRPGRSAVHLFGPDGRRAVLVAPELIEAFEPLGCPAGG